jgi:16S rRNA (adenine1518-N6/adenine1519-N6)-dimethyltransferase
MVSIRKELAEYGLVPKKGWGQHFLTDPNILNKVIRTAHLEKGDVVLEVGPGLGEMTLAMARQVKKVIAVEIDSKFVEILRRKASSFSNAEIIKGDILKIDFNQIYRQEGQRLKVVANLPYKISTPLLFRLVESREIFSTLTLMLQREVAERMVASPGGKDYGPLSVFIQSFSDLSICFFIKPSAFFPPPKVESAVIHMVWKERAVVELEEAWFKKVVRGCFGYRRKRLINALKHSNIPLPADLGQRLKRIGVDPLRRPETLTIQELARLADALRS